MKPIDNDTMKLNWDAEHDYWRIAKGMGNSQDPDHYPKLKVDYNHEGQFTFVIQNAPPGVTFAAQNPFTEKTGKLVSKDFGDQFTVSQPDAKTIVVTDLNATKGGGKYDGRHYAYELHFSSGKSVDPIITNGGCCGGTSQGLISQNDLAFYALGVAAIAAIILLIIRLNRRSAPVTTVPVTKDIDQG